MRNALTLAGCLAVLGVASGFALSALNSYSGPPTRTGRVAVQVERWTGDTVMQVRTLGTVRVGELSAADVVPAGTVLDVVTSTLAGAEARRATPAVGSRLECDLRVGRNEHGETVVDLANCVPNAPSSARS